MTEIRWSRINNLDATVGELGDFMATYIDISISKRN